MMSPVLDYAYYPLWIAHPILQIGLAVLIVKRKLLERYPVFFSYLLAEIMIFVALFATQREYNYYFYMYWVTAAISIFLGFRVIHEIFLDVLHPYHALRDLSKLLFNWVGILVVFIALVAALTGTEAGPSRIAVAMLSLIRSVRVMQCGLVLFLLMFSNYLGISRRHPSFGIAMGFGVFAAVELAQLALRVTGAISGNTLNIGSMAVYNVALLIWATYLFRPALQMCQAESLLKPQRWDMTLTELTHPVEPESLMPMFDAMVDRALSRSATSENKPEMDASQVSNPETEEAAFAAAAGGSRNVVSSR
jgi:hypothetical protein